MTNVSICWCECDSLWLSHKVVRLESALTLKCHCTEEAMIKNVHVLLFTWGYIWQGTESLERTTTPGSSQRDYLHQKHWFITSSLQFFRTATLKIQRWEFPLRHPHLSSKSQQSSSTRFATPAAVTVGFWDVSQSGVTHQLCGSHVIFRIQMVCQMRSCQSSDRAHTPPAYKQTH